METAQVGWVYLFFGSERVPPSESKGPPRTGPTCLSCVVLNFGGFFDSLRSLKMTDYWAAPAIPLTGTALQRVGAQGDTLVWFRFR